MIEYDQKQLEQYKLNVAMLQQAITSYDRKKSLGMTIVQNPNGSKNRLEISMQDRNTGEPNLKQIPVANVNGRVVYLDELARIENRQQQASNFFRINGLTALNVNVVCDRTANQIALANKIGQIEQQIRKELMPGYSLQKTFDSSEYLKKEMNKTLLRTSFSFLFLFFFVFLINRKNPVSFGNRT